MESGKEICFYVAPDGNDGWEGTMPCSTGGNGPFASLKRAVEAARECGRIPRRIVLGGGSYYDSSVRLGSADSGLAIEAMQEETPVLYGGRRITGWRKEESGAFWYAELPETAKGEWDFRLLVVNGKMVKRSRLPEKGAFQHLSEFNVDWMGTSGGGWERNPTLEELSTLKYKEEDLGAWLDGKSAEITVYHKWDESLTGIAGHDPQNHTLRLSIPCGHPPGAFKNHDYVVWNTREGMKQPGQFYLDRTAGRLVYWPESGEDMNSAEVIAPSCDIIINFFEKAQNVTVKGLSLAVTNTPLITPEFAAFRLPGAVQALEGLDACSFTGLKIKNTGGHGIKIMGSCQSISITGCEISHAGAGGILFQSNMKEVVKNGVEMMISCKEPGAAGDGPSSVISDSRIHHVGMVYSSAIAITGHDCNILHNEVSDTPYSGICYGGLAGIRQSGKNARIENNIVSRAMQVLNDGAAIYATFTIDGTICGNIVRDIQQSSRSESIKHAIYLDEFAEGWVVENNLVINCNHPVLNHIARANIMRNNVFLSDGNLRMSFIRCKEYKVEHNIIFAEGKVIFAGNPGAIAEFGNNLIYSLSGEYEEHYIDENYKHYDTVPLSFRDGSVKADPQFLNTAGGDYILKDESPALAMGIKQIDVSMAGRSKNKE